MLVLNFCCVIWFVILSGRNTWNCLVELEMVINIAFDSVWFTACDFYIRGLNEIHLVVILDEFYIRRRIAVHVLFVRITRGRLLIVLRLLAVNRFLTLQGDSFVNAVDVSGP